MWTDTNARYRTVSNLLTIEPLAPKSPRLQGIRSWNYRSRSHYQARDLSPWSSSSDGFAEHGVFSRIPCREPMTSILSYCVVAASGRRCRGSPPPSALRCNSHINIIMLLITQCLAPNAAPCSTAVQFGGRRNERASTSSRSAVRTLWVVPGTTFTKRHGILW